MFPKLDAIPSTHRSGREHPRRGTLRPTFRHSSATEPGVEAASTAVEAESHAVEAASLEAEAAVAKVVILGFEAAILASEASTAAADRLGLGGADSPA